MKNRARWTVLVASLLVGLLALTACARTASASEATGSRRGYGNSARVDSQDVPQASTGALQNTVSQISVGELSDAEAEGILYMREEEKLARDVYLTLYDQWQTQVFSNIASSESTHMEAIKTLIDRYELDDPAAGRDVGEFANEELQALFDQLVEQGSRSLVDALEVGAAIEEIDILDLEQYVAQTDKPDILSVYDNLTRGSRNHLRAFASSLEQQGVTYEPSYMSLEQFEDILSSGVERGGGRGGQGGQGGQGGRGRGLGGGRQDS